MGGMTDDGILSAISAATGVATHSLKRAALNGGRGYSIMFANGNRHAVKAGAHVTEEHVVEAFADWWNEHRRSAA
jgi:hypothetical protein